VEGRSARALVPAEVFDEGTCRRHSPLRRRRAIAGSGSKTRFRRRQLGLRLGVPHAIRKSAPPPLCDKFKDVTSAGPDLKLAIKQWQGSAHDLSLSDYEVHVWHRPLPAAADEIAHLSRVLSEEEKHRASRFRSQSLQSDFIVARGTLRLLLGAYLRLNPAQLIFEYSAHGKPSLTAPHHWLDFNLSHTDGLVVYALAMNRRVGVDVEKLRSDFDTDKLARRFFSTAEQATLESLPPADRHQAFYLCWSRKEAYIKARGEGLSHPLHRFDVSLEVGSRHALLQTRPDPQEAGRWMLSDLALQPGYAAAVALELAARSADSDRPAGQS